MSNFSTGSLSILPTVSKIAGPSLVSNLVPGLVDPYETMYLPTVSKIAGPSLVSNLVPVDPYETMYTLDEKQKVFIDKLILLVNSNWYRTKYSPTAYKRKGSAKITTIQNDEVLETLAEIKQYDKYDDNQRDLLKKLRQKYKRYRRDFQAVAEKAD